MLDSTFNNVEVKEKVTGCHRGLSQIVSLIWWISLMIRSAGSGKCCKKNGSGEAKQEILTWEETAVCLPSRNAPSVLLCFEISHVL